MDFTKTLCDLAETMKVGFVLHSKPISCQDVFAETGLLPAIAKRADQLCLLCLGYGIGVNFIESDKSILGIKARFDEATPDILRLLYFYDVIEELVAASEKKDNVVLDELLYD